MYGSNRVAIGIVRFELNWVKTDVVCTQLVLYLIWFGAVFGPSFDLLMLVQKYYDVNIVFSFWKWFVLSNLIKNKVWCNSWIPKQVYVDAIDLSWQTELWLL